MTNEIKLTAYAASKIVNDVLDEQGLNKTIRPQMIYNYVSKGYIKSYQVDGKTYVDVEDFGRWLKEYVEKIKSGTAANRVDVKALRNALNI